MNSGRLIAALAKAELHVGHRTFHARGLTVGKHQLAVAIHEVDELVVGANSKLTTCAN
jgi:hypothetical protein